jgi:NitT/TauT family transport system substrate-binding protein
LRKAADLNGKTVATRDLSNMSYFAAKLWIDSNGGDSKTIHWVEINDPQDVAALQAGRIDAASISEPALDGALHGGEVRTLAPIFDAIAHRFLIGGYFTSQDYARAHPDVVRKFADVIAVTSDWANKNRAQSGAILAKYAQAPVLPDSTRVTYPDRMRASDVQPVLDLLLKYGLLKAPMRASDLFAPGLPAR